MATLPNTSIQTIVSKITDAFNKIQGVDTDRSDARKLLEGAAQSATNAREDLLVNLANVATSEKWESDDIDAAIDQALKARNSQDNSIKTFASEIKRACHRNARKHVGQLRELATQVWDAENADTDGDKNLPKPCRKAFARKYHMLGRMISEAMDGNVFEGTSEVVQFALANDPAKDPKKAFKRVTAMRDQLRALADEFAVDGVIAAYEELNTTVGDGLKAFAKSLTNVENTKPVQPSNVVEDTDNEEPAEGVSDLLDQVVGDLSA
jgi:hypothetical protein